MRWILSATVAVCLAAISSVVGGAQAPDKFTLACTLPFDAISVHRPLDTSCENEGRPKPEDGAVAANQEQNRAKNNFCAVGSPVTVTKKTFKDLETKAEALEHATAGSAHPFTFGEHKLVPEDRSAIRADGFHQTSDGAEVHEGTLVRTVAFLMEAKYSSTSGESVNCNFGHIGNSGIHLVLAASKAAASAATPNACESFTAEITPHFRPDEWLILSILHKTQTDPRAAWKRIVALELDRPLRIAGQMFFDGSHRPCVGEEGRPPRISVWEIHPVYAVDVCKKSLASCRVNVANDWKPLDEFVQ
jgi:hypothetical protein